MATILQINLRRQIVDSGFYAACAGLLARTQALDLAANNLANASTPGYRAQHETFRALVAGRRAMQGLNLAVNSYGVIGDTRSDFSQGTLEKTGDQFDFAIEGKAFFAVQTSDGIRFTRDGNFRLRADRTLVTTSGDPVLGMQGPIRIPEGIFNASADGSLSVNGALAGRLRMVEFASDAELSPAGTGYYAAAAAAAQPARTSVVRQSMLESSNVQPVAAAVSLITIQREAESMQKALSLFHNEFNRIAAEELPRV